jgi:hypothetical protein
MPPNKSSRTATIRLSMKQRLTSDATYEAAAAPLPKPML